VYSYDSEQTYEPPRQRVLSPNPCPVRIPAPLRLFHRKFFFCTESLSPIFGTNIHFGKDAQIPKDARNNKKPLTSTANNNTVKTTWLYKLLRVVSHTRPAYLISFKLIPLKCRIFFHRDFGTVEFVSNSKSKVFTLSKLAAFLFLQQRTHGIYLRAGAEAGAPDAEPTAIFAGRVQKLTCPGMHTRWLWGSTGRTSPLHWTRRS